MHKLFTVFTFLLITAPLCFADTTVIPEVSLTPQKQTTQTQQTPKGQMTIISRKAIAESPETTLSSLLQNQSIVRLANTSGDSSQTAISLRGFGENAVANSLILVDGFPLTNPTLTAPNFNAIMLSNMQKLTIFQGSEGSLYGDQAVGGVMDITTRHPEKAFADLGLAYGSYNKKFLSGIAGDKWNNGLFLKFSGFANQTENYRNHNDQSNNGAAIQEGLDYANGSLTLDQKVYFDNYQFPGGLTLQQYEQNPRQATDSSDYSHSKTQIYQILSKQALNNNWVLETRLAHNDIHGFGYIFSPYNSYQWLNRINPQLVGVFAKNKITLGYSGEQSNYRDISSMVQTQSYSMQNDLYAQDIIPLLKRLDLTLGARGAWQSNTPEIVLGQPTHNLDRVFVSEQGLTYHLTNAMSLFVRRDGNFRFPKANEEVWLPTDQTSLKPQTGVSYETGMEWKTNRQKAQVSIYRLQLHNEIAFNPTQTATQPFGATNNLPDTLRQGITLTENYQLTKKWVFDSQFNYVDARFNQGVDSGDKIPDVPAWNANAGLSYNFLEHWKTTYSALYTGSTYASEDLANVGTRVPAYWLNNVSLQYFLKQSSVNFEINNLFNQRYTNYVVYNQDTQSNSYYPAPGRNFLLTAKIGFD